MIQRPNQSYLEASLRRYFEVVPKPSTTTPIFIAIAGFIITLICISSYAGQSGSGSELGTGTLIFLIIGPGLVLVGIIRFALIKSEYSKALSALQPQPSDAEVDMFLSDSLQRLLQHSRNLLNLVGIEREFSKPLVIQVPTLEPTYGVPTEDLKWRKGGDGKLRFSIYKLVIIYLTERHLAAYTCDFNSLRDTPLNETTREYHYQDIVSVATFECSQSFTLPTGQKLSTSQTFRLAVASGEYIEVRIDNDQLRKMTKEEEVPSMVTDQAVSTIRAMLREKKTAVSAA